MIDPISVALPRVCRLPVPSLPVPLHFADALRFMVAMIVSPPAAVGRR